MGCSYFATENGDFRLVFRNGQGKMLGVIDLEDIGDSQEIYTELEAGRYR